MSARHLQPLTNQERIFFYFFEISPTLEHRLQSRKRTNVIKVTSKRNTKNIDAFYLKIYNKQDFQNLRRKAPL
jgi:hypothetical protein